MKQTNIIEGLAREVYKKEKSMNQAALVLCELSKIPVSSAWDMVNKKVVSFYLREAVAYEQDQNEDRLNDMRNRAHARELAARWGE